MDITFETQAVWQFAFEFNPLGFISAASAVLREGDVAIFGAYEPTPEMISALIAAGAAPRAHIPEFSTCFDLNRSEHPHGSAFEYSIGAAGFARILSIEPSALRQKDIPSFYDHFIAFRPGSPRIALISFHDAACGGTLYISGHYEKDVALGLAARLSGSCKRVRNPSLRPKKRAGPAAADDD
jgi:hypothetical protein